MLRIASVVAIDQGRTIVGLEAGKHNIVSDTLNHMAGLAVCCPQPWSLNTPVPAAAQPVLGGIESLKIK